MQYVLALSRYATDNTVRYHTTERYLALLYSPLIAALHQVMGPAPL
jgi:hypothetical protein